MHSKHSKPNTLGIKILWGVMGALVGLLASTLLESRSAHAISSRSRFDGPALEDGSADSREMSDLDSGYLDARKSESDGRYILWPRVTVGIVMQDASGNLHMVPLQGDAVEASVGSTNDRSMKRYRDAAFSRCMDAVDSMVQPVGGLNSGLFLLPQGNLKQ